MLLFAKHLQRNDMFYVCRRRAQKFQNWPQNHTTQRVISFGKRLNLIWATVALVLSRPSPAQFCFARRSSTLERPQRALSSRILLAIAGPVVQTTKFFMGKNKVLRGNLPLRRCDTSNNNVTCHRQRSALKKRRKLSLPQTNSDRTSSSQIAQPHVMVAQKCAMTFPSQKQSHCGQCSSEDFACLWVEGPEGQDKQILRWMHVLMCGYSWFPTRAVKPAGVHAHRCKPMKSKKRNSRKRLNKHLHNVGGRTWLFRNSIFSKNDVNDAGQMRNNPTVNYEISLNMFYESSQGWQQQARTNFEDANQLV